MNQQELKHEWSIDPNAGWFRLWEFIYRPEDPNKLTFCKLFWGFIFMPLMAVTMLPVRYIVGMVGELWDWIAHTMAEKKVRWRANDEAYQQKRREEKAKKAAEPPPPPKPPREPVLIPHVEAFVTWLKVGAKRLPRPIKLTTVSKLVGYLGMAIGAIMLVVGAAMVAGLVLGLVWIMVHFWPITGFAVAGIIAAAILIVGFMFLAALILDHPDVFFGALMVLGVASIIGGIIWAGITFWAVVQSILIIAAVVITALAFIIAVTWATIKWGGEPIVEYVVRPTHKHILAPTGRGVVEGGVGFATVMKIGYKSVKTNTCPRIRIKGSEE